MAHRSSGSCRTVAPLVARYSDPDLTEAEYVLLSTHLLCCRACQERLNAYRAADQRLRQLPSITIAPEARTAVLREVTTAATSAKAYRRPHYLAPWISVASGAVVAIALMLVTGFRTLDSVAPPADGPDTFSKAESAFNRSLTAALMIAPPTQAAIVTMSDPARATATIATFQRQSLPRVSVEQEDRAITDGGAAATRTAVRQVTAPETTGKVYAVSLADRHLQVWNSGTGQLETYVMSTEVIVTMANGRSGTLAEIRPDMVVRLRLDHTRTGMITVREITILP